MAEGKENGIDDAFVHSSDCHAFYWAVSSGLLYLGFLLRPLELLLLQQMRENGKKKRKKRRKSGKRKGNACLFDGKTEEEIAVTMTKGREGGKKKKKRGREKNA